MDDENGTKQDEKIKIMFKQVFNTPTKNIKELSTEAHNAFITEKKKEDEKTTEDYIYLIEHLKQHINTKIIYSLFIIHCNTQGRTDQTKLLNNLNRIMNTKTENQNLKYLKYIYESFEKDYNEYNKIESLLTRNLNIGKSQYQYIV